MKLIREKRKTISIFVNEEGEVTIKAPRFLSENEIKKFLYEKKNWIIKQKEKMKNKKDFIESLDFEKNIYINGVGYSWTEISQQDKRKTKASYYTSLFNDLIIKKANKIAENLNITHVIFKLCNSQCIWGSCNLERVIKLNWKIVILPENLQNYIIIHELMHIKEMNHSKNFWANVSIYDPNYKKNREELKKYSVILPYNVLK